MEKYKLTSENLDKNLPYAKGVERKLLEADTLLLNNDLARETLKKLKKDFWFNIFYIVLGFALGFVPLSMKQDKSTSAIIELTKSINEKNAQKIEIQTEFHKMRLEITSLRKELESLKIE